jgi:hypothetical protein
MIFARGIIRTYPLSDVICILSNISKVRNSVVKIVNCYAKKRRVRRFMYQSPILGLMQFIFLVKLVRFLANGIRSEPMMRSLLDKFETVDNYTYHSHFVVTFQSYSSIISVHFVSLRLRRFMYQSPILSLMPFVFLVKLVRSEPDQNQ